MLKFTGGLHPQRCSPATLAHTKLGLQWVYVPESAARLSQSSQLDRQCVVAQRPMLSKGISTCHVVIPGHILSLLRLVNCLEL